MQNKQEKDVNVPIEGSEFEDVLANESYTEAGEQVEPIAQDLILNHHQHLKQARIKYLFDLREKPKMSKGRAVAASISKPSSLLKLFSRCEYIMVIHGDTWQKLDDAQKNALVDHELCHAIRDSEGFFQLQGHDLEEFAAVIERHGFWRKDVMHMAAAMQKEFIFTKWEVKRREVA